MSILDWIGIAMFPSLPSHEAGFLFRYCKVKKGQVELGNDGNTSLDPTKMLPYACTRLCDGTFMLKEGDQERLSG